MEALKNRVSDHSEKSMTIVSQMFRNEKGQCKYTIDKTSNEEERKNSKPMIVNLTSVKIHVFL